MADTKFIIITTAIAPQGSASFLLRETDRNISNAYKILKITAEKSQNLKNEKYYKAFLETPAEIIQSILANVTIIDSCADISDVVYIIKKAIRYSAPPFYCDKMQLLAKHTFFCRKAVNQKFLRCLAKG